MSMIAPPKAGYKIEDAAKRSGYTERQLYYMVEKKKIRYIKRSGKIVLHPADVDALTEKANWVGEPIAAEDSE